GLNKKSNKTPSHLVNKHKKRKKNKLTSTTYTPIQLKEVQQTKSNRWRGLLTQASHSSMDEKTEKKDKNKILTCDLSERKEKSSRKNFSNLTKKKIYK